MTEQGGGDSEDRMVYVPLRMGQSALARIDIIAWDCRTSRSNVIRTAFDEGIDAAERKLRQEAAERAAERTP